jgi:hypothetical protein
MTEEKGLMPHIGAMWAFLAIDSDGDEGVCAFKGPTTWMPMVAADEKRLSSLRQMAQKLANERGVTIRLVKFTAREDLDIIAPVPAMGWADPIEVPMIMMHKCRLEVTSFSEREKAVSREWLAEHGYNWLPL